VLCDNPYTLLNGIIALPKARACFPTEPIFSAKMNIGYTEVDTVNTSLINNSDNLLSYGWKAQIDNELDDNWSLTSFLARPISVFSGSMNINAPTSRIGDSVVYTNTEWSQSAKAETDLGIEASFIKDNFSWNIGGVKRYDTALGDTWFAKTTASWNF